MAKIKVFGYAAKVLGLSPDYSTIVLDIPVTGVITFENLLVNVAEQYPNFMKLIERNPSPEYQLMRVFCEGHSIFGCKDMQFIVDDDTVAVIIPLHVEG